MVYTVNPKLTTKITKQRVKAKKSTKEVTQDLGNIQLIPKKI